MINAILTIDDIPSNNTKAIVDFLNEKNITVVMFAEGNRLKTNPEPVIYALQHGMLVGNHSFTHPHFSELTLDEAVKEIEKCEEQLDRVYEMAGVERKYRPFRFPYGDKGGENKGALQEYLADHSFNKLVDTQIPYPYWKEFGLDKDIDTLWTFDFAEYNIRQGSGFTADDVFKRINDPNPTSGAAMLAEGGSHIILLHAHDETDALVPGYYRQFVDYLLEHGVVFNRPAFF